MVDSTETVRETPALNDLLSQAASWPQDPNDLTAVVIHGLAEHAQAAYELLATVLESYESCCPDWWPSWPDAIQELLDQRAG